MSISTEVLADGSDDHGTIREGKAGDYFYHRPHEILINENDRTKVERLLRQQSGTAAMGSNQRAAQRQAKRDGPAPFGVGVFVLDEGADVIDTIRRLRDHDVTCDFNYVTAPAPMRSHAVSYAEPSNVDKVHRPHSPGQTANVTVGILDTGRPIYDAAFRDYYVARYETAAHPAAAGARAASPLALLDDRFMPRVKGITAGSDHDDQDLMVSSFGRLAHPYAGHGMFVASIVARYAPTATLLAETTLSGDSIGDLFDMLVDIDHAVGQGCRVLNMSMGFHADPGNGATCPVFLDVALNTIAEADVKLVASAGNDGSDRYTWPAAHTTVAAVAATDDDGNPTEWSNYGSWVDACAPGNDVDSDYVYADWDYPDDTAKRFRGAARWSGTSFSAPHVTALLADRYGAACAAAARTGQEPPPVESVWSDLLGKASADTDPRHDSYGRLLKPDRWSPTE